jgi:hypothetical protein
MVLTHFAYSKELRAARAAAHRGGRNIRTASGATEYHETGAGIPVLSIDSASGGYDHLRGVRRR